MEAENQGAARGVAVGAPAERPPRSRAGWPTRSRWLVHLGLLAFVTVNVVVSGLLDWNRGAPLLLPSSRNLSTGGICSPLPCSSCIW
jgi:hypothetical protein